MKNPVKPKRIKIDPKKLTTKSRLNNNGRTPANICPNCLSLLIIENGILVCSGDKLTIWENDFNKFKNMNNEEKTKYLETISNIGKFFEIYDKWTNDRLDCEYSNRLYDGSSVYKTEIPDPLFINRIERSLGRQLTEEEKFGQETLWVKDGTYSAEYEEGSAMVEIPFVIFPDGC